VIQRLDVQRLLLLVFLGVMFVAAAVATAQPSNLDTDLWWHLANGRYILAHGVPSVDVYSHTAAGHVWVVHEWLADILMYLLHGLGGLSALVILGAVGDTGIHENFGPGDLERAWPIWEADGYLTRMSGTKLLAPSTVADVLYDTVGRPRELMTDVIHVRPASS